MVLYDREMSHDYICCHVMLCMYVRFKQPSNINNINMYFLSFTGKMLLDDKKNVAHNPYRRPYACGVLDLVPVLEEKEDEASRLEDGYTHSFNMPLYLW